MLRKLLPRTRTAFESRTQVWREVGLGSEIDPAIARRSKGGALVLLALIAGVLVCFTERKALFPGYGLEVRIADGHPAWCSSAGAWRACWLGDSLRRSIGDWSRELPERSAFSSAC